MDPITLREAARRTSRSITTLRRYIRRGKLRAEKRPGRFGPEYVVTERALAAAGLQPEPAETALATADSRNLATRIPVAAESVPLGLFQELQMKHEQLLVQYGMVRAGGMRVMELRAELETKQRQIDTAEARLALLKRRTDQEAGRLKALLRQAELEQEGQGLEIAALREKVRALEMLTRNAVTTESIEKQFSEIMAQTGRVQRMARSAPPSGPGPRADSPQDEKEH